MPIKIKVNNDLYEQQDFIKDCPAYTFIPSIMPAVERIIAIGDIHGDLKLAIQSFKLAKLIDDNLNWIADPANTIVVQVGDQIDSCRPIPGVHECNIKNYDDDRAEDMDVMKFFDIMHEKASRVGGAVYSLLGNHELMNAQSNFKYVSYKNQHEFKYQHNDDIYEGKQGRKTVFKPGGVLAKHMACSRPSVMIIGSTMFAHAGVLPVLASRIDYLGIDNQSKLKYLNSVVRKWLLKKISDAGDDANRKMFINDMNVSPFWVRVYGSIPPDVDLDSSECSDSVKKAIQVYKIGQLVIGHTPQMYTNNNGINGTCHEKGKGNKLFRVDGGFSRAFNVFGNKAFIQVLEIINDKDFNIITQPIGDIPYQKPSDLDMSRIIRKSKQSIINKNTVNNKSKNFNNSDTKYRG